MLAFGYLRADIVRQRLGAENNENTSTEFGMGFDELRGVYNVLVEKELRIHVDIERLLDDMVVDDGLQRQQGNSRILFDMPDDAESGDEMRL